MELGHFYYEVTTRHGQDLEQLHYHKVAQDIDGNITTKSVFTFISDMYRLTKVR